MVHLRVPCAAGHLIASTPHLHPFCRYVCPLTKYATLFVSRGVRGGVAAHFSSAAGCAGAWLHTFRQPRGARRLGCAFFVSRGVRGGLVAHFSPAAGSARVLLHTFRQPPSVQRWALTALGTAFPRRSPRASRDPSSRFGLRAALPRACRKLGTCRLEVASLPRRSEKERVRSFLAAVKQSMELAASSFKSRRFRMGKGGHFPGLESVPPGGTESAAETL